MSEGVSILLLTPATPEQVAPWTAALADAGRAVEVLTGVGEIGPRLRDGLIRAAHPVVLLLALDYPYEPKDALTLLTRLDETDPNTGARLDLVNGFRARRRRPMLARLVFGGWRVLLNVLLDLKNPPQPGWLGLGRHLRARWGRFLFGLRVIDLDSGLKVVRASMLPRTPVQSDGRFALVELLAKANFLGKYMDELPVAEAAGPANPPLGPAAWGRDFRRVFAKPDFGPAVLPEPSVGA